MKTVDVDHEKANLSNLVDEALSGEEVVLTKEGKPAARLIPVEQNTAEKKKNILSTLGMLKGQIWMSDDFDDPLPDDLLRGFGVID